MAKSVVGRGRFPNFAADDRADGATHRFVVGDRFDGATMTAGEVGEARATAR